MYAIVEAGGKQIKVEKNAEFDVNQIDAKVGKEVKLKNVLLFSDGKTIEIGTPHLKDVEIICEVIKEFRGKKIIVFKYKRRKRERKTKGHRQNFTRLKVKEINIK